MRTVVVGLFTIPLLIGTPLGAQQDSVTTLPDIVITANRRPVHRDEVTSRITVITGDELRARGVRQIVDALRGVAGLTVVQTGAFGGTASLFLRGGESDYVRVLVDGVPVNEPGGSFDFAHLTADNVERIEILRGPASVLYGSDAVAGVIQIFTRHGAGQGRVDANAQGGTYGTTRLSVHAEGGSETARFSLGVSRFRSDGLYAFNNGYDNTAASGRFTVRPDARTDATFTFRYTDAEYHFPTDGAGVLADSNQFTATETTTLGVDAGRFLSDRLEVRAQLGLNDIGSLFDDQQDNVADTVGFFRFRSQREIRTRSADGRINYYLSGTSVLTAGAAIGQEWERTDADRTRLNRSYYAQAVAALPAGLSVNAGVRVDDNDRFGTFVTYRGGVGYRFSFGSRVHVGAASGFKAPSFFETFDSPFSVGNPTLEVERSRSWEAGVEQLLLSGRVVASATYFVQRFRDLIQFTFASPNPGDPNYFNVAEADADGVEVEVEAVPLRGLRVRANYTRLRTDVRDAGFDDGPDATFVVGDRLLRRPTHAFAALAQYSLLGRASLGAEVRYMGTRDDRDFATFPATRMTLPAYTVLDLSATVDVIAPRRSMPGLAATIRIENALDEAYAQAVNFPALGRTVVVGGRLSM